MCIEFAGFLNSEFANRIRFANCDLSGNGPLDCVHKMRCLHIFKMVKNVTDMPPVHTKAAHFSPADFENGRF